MEEPNYEGMYYQMVEHCGKLAKTIAGLRELSDAQRVTIKLQSKEIIELQQVITSKIPDVSKTWVGPGGWEKEIFDDVN